MQASGKAPAYSPELGAFHREFEGELRSLLSELPFRSGMKVVDAACGDGFFVDLLAERVGETGLVIGLDSNLPILLSSETDQQALLAGALERPPFVFGQFDAVFCCQSLFSLPDPVQTLRRLAAWVRPKGFVAVLENDSLHQLMLPWDPKLELAIRAAEYAAFKVMHANPRKFYVGRHLPQCLREAGLEPRGFHTRTMDRLSPLTNDAESFLSAHLYSIVDRVSAHLDPWAKVELNDLIGVDRARIWLRESGFTFTWLNVLAWGETAAAGAHGYGKQRVRGSRQRPAQPSCAPHGGS